jgi:hypothetical protein
VTATPHSAGMRHASPPLDRHGHVCESCGRFTVTAVEGVFVNPQVGSTPRFCSSACRSAAYRRRRAGAPEDAPRQRNGGRGRRLGADTNTDTRLTGT